MSVVECLEQSDQVRCGSCDNEDMEYLMRAAEHIKSAWIPFLGYSGSIYHCASDIKRTLKYQPRQPDLFPRLVDSIQPQTVKYWKHGAQAQSYEHACSERSPEWSSELLFD